MTPAMLIAELETRRKRREAKVAFMEAQRRARMRRLRVSFGDHRAMVFISPPRDCSIRTREALVARIALDPVTGYF